MSLKKHEKLCFCNIYNFKAKSFYYKTFNIIVPYSNTSNGLWQDLTRNCRLSLVLVGSSRVNIRK